MSAKNAKAQRQRTAQRCAYLAAQRVPKQYWHGGAPGLSVGDELLSRIDAEELLSTPTTHGIQNGYALGVTRADRVYFSSRKDFARAYAARHQGVDQTTGVIAQRGTLYRVEPLGVVEEDEDFAGNQVSWCAPKARVVAVEATDVFLEQTTANQYVGPYMTWDDDSPMYSPEGGYLPNPVLRRLGYTPSSFVGRYPSWLPFDLVEADIAGQPGGDRPNPAVHEGVGLQAASTAQVYRDKMSRGVELMTKRGVTFSRYGQDDVAEVNALLAVSEHHTRIQETGEDPRGVALALDPQGGIVGVAVITVMGHEGHAVIWVDAVAIAEQWRHQGLGSMLLNTASKLVPADVEFIAGHCSPDVAPFFAQAGFTALRPDVNLLVPLAGGPREFEGVGEDVWFYRQSAL